MAQAKQSQAVDLFGNPTLTPRQLMQQQLASLMESTAEQTAGADPRTRGVSKMGAAAGGMLGKLLIEKGVLPKPPEMERAERLAKARDEMTRVAAEEGLDMEADPKGFARRAAGIFMKHGEEDGAAKALQWGDTREALKLAADKERAGIANLEADTALKNRNPGTGTDRAGYAVPVYDKDGRVLEFDTRAPSGQRLRDPITGKPIKGAVRDPRYTPESQSDLAFAKGAGDEGSKNLFANRQVAVDATNSLYGIAEARKLLDEGMKTGKFANFEVGLGAALQELGITYADDQVENAQAFVASQAKQVASIIKAFGAGTGLSDADREFAIKAAGGDITMNEKSIRKVLDINERASLNAIKNYKDLYGRVKKDYLPYSMELPDPPKGGAKTEKPAAGSVQDGATATNKAGEKIIFKGGKWQPLK